ncbi:MAG TPA: FHA domain-containing protein [Verrucomicrobiota bacterium]|nr:FHA domain-containing protein [Verrucomicrobiota bacterium]HNU51512.1 FHA domain-containing protein [Verrucomicrobiota bacterium]
MARLIFSGEKFQGRVYELTLATTTVGRGDHNTLVLHDPSVSHSHCEILVFGDEVIVRDLGSKNGTLVGGVRLRSQQGPLHHREAVKFGEVEARLELDESPDTDSATDLTAVHEYARVMRERQEGTLKTPAAASLELGAAPDDSRADGTVMLSAPPQASAAAETDSSAQAIAAEHSRSRTPWARIVAVLILGMGLALWLLLVNR